MQDTLMTPGWRKVAGLPLQAPYLFSYQTPAAAVWKILVWSSTARTGKPSGSAAKFKQILKSSRESWKAEILAPPNGRLGVVPTASTFSAGVGLQLDVPAPQIIAVHSLPLLISPGAGRLMLHWPIAWKWEEKAFLSNCANPHQHLPGRDFSPLAWSDCNARAARLCLMLLPTGSVLTACLLPALNEPCYVSSASIFIKNLMRCQFALLPAAAISILQRNKWRQPWIIYKQRLLSGLHPLKYV